MTYALINLLGLPGTAEDADGAPVSRAPMVDCATITACPTPSARQPIELAGYWRSKLQGPLLPTRGSIDPAEIIRHLPWIFMADVIDGGADFRYRLLGTSIVSANCRDATGRSFSELYGADPDKLAGARLGFDLALATGAPAFTQGHAFWRSDWAFDRFESVFLPLATDGRTIDIILGEIAYLSPH